MVGAVGDVFGCQALGEALLQGYPVRLCGQHPFLRGREIYEIVFWEFPVIVLAAFPEFQALSVPACMFLSFAQGAV